MRLKLKRDLLSHPENQTYLCDDQQTIEKFKLNGPFKCGCRQWLGGGVVKVEFYAYNYTKEYSNLILQESDLVLINTLTVVPNETWTFDESPWQ